MSLFNWACDETVYGVLPSFNILAEFIYSLPIDHHNIFHDRKSLKSAWVKTNNLLDADS